MLAVAGLPRLSQADVLVCSRGGGGLLRERMALARSLWDAGLAAEMLPQAAPSLTEQYEYAQSRGIAWLVIINASTFEGGCRVAGSAGCSGGICMAVMRAEQVPAVRPCACCSMSNGGRPSRHQQLV